MTSLSILIFRYPGSLDSSSPPSQSIRSGAMGPGRSQQSRSTSSYCSGQAQGRESCRRRRTAQQGARKASTCMRTGDNTLLDNRTMQRKTCSLHFLVKGLHLKSSEKERALHPSFRNPCAVGSRLAGPSAEKKGSLSLGGAINVQLSSHSSHTTRAA